MSPAISIVIPSWTGNVDRLMEGIERQTFRDYEIHVVRGVSPAARARNQGAGRARADILLFVDDDARLGSEHVLQMLYELLRNNESIAVAGTSKIVPVTATALQQAMARQVPRMVYPIVSRPVESNPPLHAYGFSAVTTTCCAVRRSAFEEVGGFDEGLPTGPEDTDFFYRIHARGYRIVLAADCWVYHDPPPSVPALLRKSFWYGMGHAWEARKSPERAMAVLPLDRWYGKLAVLASLLVAPAAFFIHYYFDPVRRIEFGFKPLKTLSTYAVLLGYVYGWQRYARPLSPVRTYMGQKSAATQGAPKNVLYVDAYPKIGGGQQVLLAITKHLDRARYEPIVALSPHNPLRQRLDDAGVRTLGITFDRASYTLPNPSKPLSVLHTGASLVRVLRAVAAMVRAERVDLIHANSVVAGLHALPSAVRFGIPCVVYAHDFNTAPSTNRLLSVFMRYKNSVAVFVSQALVDNYRNQGLLTYPHRVIYNGIDTQVFRPRSDARERLFTELGLPPNCFLIGCVGRLEAWKGHKLLVESFAKVAANYAHARLVIVGGVIFDDLSGIERDLRTQVTHLGLDDKVIFMGFRQDTPAVMAGLDALAHCPIEPEAFGLVLIEAMACARPVVTVPAGGIREIVVHGSNGLLAPVGDSAGIAAALEHLLHDPALGRRLGEEGRRTVQKKFTVERQAAQLQELYDEVLGRAGSASGTMDGRTPEDADAGKHQTACL